VPVKWIFAGKILELIKDNEEKPVSIKKKEKFFSFFKNMLKELGNRFKEQRRS
jgi:hypothetical protein